MNKKNREFFLSSWAIENKTIIYILMVIFLISGITAYNTMPREPFPEINTTNVFVATVFPGNSAEEIEKLVTNPLEEEIKGVKGLVELESSSYEGISVINVEFDDEVLIEVARQRVKDLVDNVTVRDDWPTFNNSKIDPSVTEFDFAERYPVLNITLLGDYTVEELKKYAEYLELRIERLPEIKSVEIRGLQDFEVEIAVDPFMMNSTKTSFTDIISSISQENVTISAGNIVSDGQRRNVKIVGEISSPDELENIIVNTNKGPVYLKDVASVSFKEKEATSYVRYFEKKTVGLEVIKRGGENAIFASNELSVPIIHFVCDQWTMEIGDKWHMVDNLLEASNKLRELSSTRRLKVFLTVGRKGLADFADVLNSKFLIRSIEKPLALEGFSCAEWIEGLSLIHI